jgi:hypothetical protein
MKPHLILAASKLWEIAQTLWGSCVLLIVCGVWLVLTRGRDPDEHD